MCKEVKKRIITPLFGIYELDDNSYKIVRYNHIEGEWDFDFPSIIYTDKQIICDEVKQLNEDAIDDFIKEE